MASPSGGRAAVTGAAGYVGVNLLELLLAEGWSVRALDVNPPHGAPRERVEWVVADVRDRPALERAFAGVDVVFHLAARITLATHNPEAWDINVHGAATVAAAARSRGVRLVHCSSVHAFDLARARPVLDEDGPRATAPDRPLYDRSKAAGEAGIQLEVAEGLDAVITNPAGIIGPVDPQVTRINSVLRDAARGRVPAIVEGGFSWVDVRDVALGLVAAALRGRTGENYLLPGHRATLFELTRLAARAGGHHGPWLSVPLRLAKVLTPLGEAIGQRVGSDLFTDASLGALLDDPVIDARKAARELGWAPRPLEETVGDLVASFDG